MNLWVKTYVGDKITRHTVVRNNLPLTMNNFVDNMQSVCHTLDIPTPIITESKYSNINQFNSVKFRPEDFVEKVVFDYLLVEYLIEK